MEHKTPFTLKAACFGCGLCAYACVKEAITLKEDEVGFLYPSIDAYKCCGCTRCAQACALLKAIRQENVRHAYAAACRDEKALEKSASGGIFTVLSRYVIGQGGVVCGAALLPEKDTLRVRHVMIEREEEIALLQGSKYAQSVIGDLFKQVKERLLLGKQVLFSGTPCQVAALRAYLKTPQEALITVDVICHGVSSAKLFEAYLCFYALKFGAEVVNYRFRDKRDGQGMTQAFVMRRSDGRHRVILRRGERTAYMGEYLRGNSYRESCYACPYASTERIADITLGDFWGAYQEHRDRIRELGMSDKKGISCVLTNTAKGERLFRQCQGEMRFFETHVEAIARHNAQLAHPSVRGKNVERVWRSFKKGGYAQMERDYAKDMGARRVLYLLMEKTPKRVRRAAKQALNQLRKRGD